jgi:hypothetical protein
VTEEVPSGVSEHDRTLLLLTSMFMLADEDSGVHVTQGWLAGCIEALHEN